MSRSKVKPRTSTSKSKPSAVLPTAASLIDKSHTLLAQSNFELAIKFLERALELESTNLEARELIGIAELEGGDEERGRDHLLHLFPPYTENPPTHPSPYLYLAQCSSSPQESLGYYSTATAMIENNLKEREGKGKAPELGDVDEEEERKMAVTALVAMIEIWMSDLCFEEAAPTNCDSLIARALSISPNDPEARLSLASIRMSQSKFDEAKEVVVALYIELEGKEPFDETLPALPARLLLTRLLLEHSLHLEAIDVLSTIREEDSLSVEGAYLEGWALYLRAEALIADPSLATRSVIPKESTPAKPVETDDIDLQGIAGDEDEEDDTPMTAEQCLEESMRSLLECAKLYSEQDYDDEGIGSHVAELLEGLEKRGIKPALLEGEGEEDGEAMDEEVSGWEDVQEDGDVAMV